MYNYDAFAQQKNDDVIDMRQVNQRNTRISFKHWGNCRYVYLPYS